MSLVAMVTPEECAGASGQGKRTEVLLNTGDWKAGRTRAWDSRPFKMMAPKSLN